MFDLGMSLVPQRESHLTPCLHGSTVPVGDQFARAGNCMSGGLSAPLSATPTFRPVEFGLVMPLSLYKTTQNDSKGRSLGYRLDTNS
jgi:hypothetical protein